MTPAERSAAVRLRQRLGQAWVTARDWVRRYLSDESHLFALTLLVGVVCGLVAVAFHLAIRAMEHVLIDRALGATGALGWGLTIVTPMLGGLAAGAALTFLAPGARGSGIPQVKQAFAFEGGRVRLRDAIGKFIIAAVQIGAGASLGREGPTAQICAGATSALARVTALPTKSVRRLLPVGVAAGIAAAFNAPIAAVTFTIEEIVGSLDHAVLSGVVVAAALAAVIERGILGVHPVIVVDRAYALDHVSSLPIFALMGLAAGVISVTFTDSLLKLRAGFSTFRLLPRWTHPAVGGLVSGALAAVALHVFGTTGVTGGGYDTLTDSLGGKLGFGMLLGLGLAKLVATVFSYSSGGAGGIFAPSLFIGAMLGGAFGYLDVLVFDHEDLQRGAFALVGMGAVFAGVIRAPITSVLIIFEMTGGYGLVLPLMLANMTSYVVARRLRARPIYEELLLQDGITLPHAPLVASPLPAGDPGGVVPGRSPGTQPDQ
ncbi:MAG: chloride channel protein [Myxococcaceae bacterium]|nr:chloride channel protein [Myxococcaceae bacterium]